MFKSLCLALLFCLVMIYGQPQNSIKPGIPTASYHPPAADKVSWQWLNLMMSATHYRVINEGEVDFDSCLLYASRSLGVSRITVLGEGMEDREWLAQSPWIDRRNPAAGLRLLAQQKGKKHLEQLILLGAYYAFQPQRNYPADSAAYFLTWALRESQVLKEEKLRRQAMCLLGKMYFEINDVQRGDSVFSRLIKECQVAGDRETQAKALFYWGFYPPYAPETTPQRIAYFQRAADLYHGLRNTEGEINALTDAGYLMVPLAQIEKAYEAFVKALELAEAIRYPYTHYNTDALAMVTLFEGKFGEPLKYTIETIRTAETTRDSIGWAGFYSRLGLLYHMEGGREEESLKALLKAMERFVRNGEAGSVNLYNTTVTLGELDRYREALELVSNVSKKVPPRQPRDQIFNNLSFSMCYRGLKQFKLAEQYALEADRIQKQFPTLRGADQRAMINSVLGVLYFKTGQFAKSKKYLEEWLANSSDVGLFKNLINTYSMLIAIDSVFGDAASAMKRYKQYKMVLDSSYRISKIRQAEELQVMYQTQDKENQISLLNEQAKLEQAHLKQATLVRNVTIGGIVAAMIIAALLYRQNRVKQRNNVVITHKNEQLQHLLTEKEWLLKEIHHRVKNNLQVVMSLLNSQTAFIDNEPALTAIHDSQHRVHAMSLIHQKLYSSDNVSSIDMSVYVRELAAYLVESFDMSQRIRFEYYVEPLNMDVGQAVPLGLILNEAITNALKYAFPKGRSGVIIIALTTPAPHHYELCISDDGIGMPSDFDPNKTNSLGMTLMRGLSEDLDGDFFMESRNGTTIKVSFVHDLGVRRPETFAASLVSEN